MNGITRAFGKARRLMMIALSIGVVQIPAGAWADAGQETFATPEKAVDALLAANRAGDTDGLLKILGPQAEKLLSSGDPVADKDGRERFVAAYDTAHKLESDDNNDKVLIVGAEEWPLPIPLVQQNGRWHFDTKTGEDEILNRRIGRNELNVIEVCRSYVEAQREYAGQSHGDYAQHFLSTPDTHDGLYWPVNEGEQESPLGPLIADARAEGYFKDTDRKERQPYHGYYYKIIKEQGLHAPGGAKSYVQNDHMTGGFALIAFPATYGDSGIMTFMVDDDGIVYEKDLGPDTGTLAPQITQYDPDTTWKIL